MNNDKSRPQAVARIASSDVAMTAALIRIANSPLYARREPVSSVAQAVSMLSMKPTASLLNATQVFNSSCKIDH